MSRDSLHHEVLIAGFGGQGVVLAGKLLATAALSEGREVVWAPSYGPEMRGGPVQCTVVISSRRIGSPEASLVDSLLIMDGPSLDRFATRVKPGGLLILNSSLVPVPDGMDGCTLLPVPATGSAEALGESRVANVIMLGALLAQREVVSPDSLVEAMRQVAGKTAQHLVEINCRALARGIELAGADRAAVR